MKASLPKPSKLRRALSRAKNWAKGGTQYPWVIRNEVQEVTKVLKSSQWNMGYGIGQVHESLEREFAEYTENREAVAVNTGGMALQIAMRALGIKPGDEVIHRVDTCVANAFSVINAGAAPIFVDSDPETLGMSIRSLEHWISPQTKMIIPVHLWGNPEDLSQLKRLVQTRNLTVIEDCCLALGAKDGLRHVGHDAAAAVFSFGCVKPIQAGEGGMIVTQDKSLAREMRSIRSWGERSREFGDSDVTTLSWNGRMSEIVAAVVLEQLRGYPRLLKEIRDNAMEFVRYLSKHPWIRPLHSPGKSSYNQFMIKFDARAAGFSRGSFGSILRSLGAGVEAANFEPMTRYSFFKKGLWKPWVSPMSQARCSLNYSFAFPGAERIFDTDALGLSRNNFLGNGCVKTLIRRFEKAVSLASSQPT